MKHAEGAGANCELRGASGEGGCWQYMTSTWNDHVVRVYGEWKPRDSYERERYVVTKIVEEWVAQGYTASQIALKWNAGERATRCSAGINSKGVPYDSCRHIQKVLAYFR